MKIDMIQGNIMNPEHPEYENLIQSLPSQRIKKLEEQVKLLREALEPFSKEASCLIADTYLTEEGPFGDYKAIVAVEDLFNARKIYMETE